LGGGVVILGVMTKKKTIGEKKVPDMRPSYVEVNYSAEAMRLLYEATGQRMPKPAVPRPSAAAAEAAGS
jgi:hypothetical protein